MLEVRNLSVKFGEMQALHPVSLSFERGQFTVLLGSSGAGKSTLLRCLNQLQGASSGQLVAKDIGVLNRNDLVREHRRRTAMIFQQHHLITRRSALQNVLTGRLSRHSGLRSLFPLPRQDHEIALRSLERVGLLDKALFRADQLSGGQQQRVGIARALAQEPQLLLADEPVSSLDPATADGVLALLSRICREDGIAAVVSLHQLDLARRYADRIIGLSHGRLVFDGAPAQLTDARAGQLYQQAFSPAPHEPTPIPALWPARAFATIED